MARLAHTLRNPLAPIVSALELMALRPDDPVLVERARKTIARQVSRLDSMIDALARTGTIEEAAETSHATGTTDTTNDTAGATPPEPQPRESDTAQQQRLASGAGDVREILIVDDNVEAAESLGALLKAAGHHIRTAHDGPSALAQAARLRPEVVILDIGMPTMNGYQLAQRLRDDIGLTSTLLVALTGYAEDRDRIEAHAAGFDFHLSKPVDIARLAEVLRNAH